MAVEFHAAGQALVGFDPSATHTVVADGDDCYVLAMGTIGSSSDKVSGVTCNGAAMTRIRADGLGLLAQVTYVYGLAIGNKSAETQTIVWTFTAGDVGMRPIGRTFKNVNQSSPIADQDGIANATLSSPVNFPSVTAPSGSMTVDYIAIDDEARTLTPGAGQTESGTQGNEITHRSAGSRKADATAMSWTFSGGGTQIVSASVIVLNPTASLDTTPPDITSTGTGSTNGPFAANVAENSTAAFITLTASENVIWGALGGADASRFVKVNETATTVQLALNQALNFESLPHANPFVVTVPATDGASNSRTVTVNATVTNVNEPPGAPTIGTATAGNASASVAFTPPAANGGPSPTSYTATSSPGGITGTGASSPITVSGLTNGVAYTFTVTATNSEGTSSPSAASNSVTPTAPGDSTPPTLTSPTGAGGQMVCSGSVSTNEGNGTLYAVATASATAPTKNQVKLGQNHLGAAGLRVVNQAVSATGVQNIASGAIASEGVRYWHYMHEDAAGNQSEVASSAAFTVTAYSMTIGPFGVAGVQQNSVQVHYSLSMGRGPGEMSVVKQGTVTTDGTTGLATIQHTAPGQAMVCYSPVAGTTFDVNKHTCVRYGTLA